MPSLFVVSLGNGLVYLVTVGLALVLALPLRNIMNLLMKLSTFPRKFKLLSQNLHSKKVQGVTLKTTDLFHFCY